MLEKLHRERPEIADINTPLIEALMGARQWAKAEGVIRRSLTLQGADKVDLQIKLGMVLLRQLRADEAVGVLREAVKVEPDNALAQFNLGASLLHVGNLDESERALRRAYQLEGAKMAGAQMLLGQVCFQKKDYPQAITAFETYLRDLPDAPNTSQVKDAISKLRQAIGKQ